MLGEVIRVIQDKKINKWHQAGEAIDSSFSECEMELNSKMMEKQLGGEA
jgi:hypothetical protein